MEKPRSVKDIQTFSAPAGVQHTSNYATYVDFIPACLKEMGFMRLPQYESFDVLFVRGNEWLAANPGFKVINCESFEVKCEASFSSTRIKLQDSSYIEAGNQPNAFIRLLRLWLTPKDAQDSPEPVRLGYLNVVPACLDSGGLFKLPKFEPFNVTISKMNDMLMAQPLQGNIINIETQDMKFSQWKDGGVNPDKSFWYEEGKGTTFFLVVIRIFYAAGPPAMETIGCSDIVPSTNKVRFLQVEAEPFTVLAQRANQWIQENQGVHVTNVQSVNYKLDTSWFGDFGSVDTMRSLFYKEGTRPTLFLRIIRICFVVPAGGAAYGATSGHLPGPPQLTYRTFLPALVRQGATFSIAVHEPMSNTRQRLEAWLRHTGARVLSAETITLIIDNSARYTNPDETYTLNRGSQGELVLYAYRIYLDGVYADPPPGVLPEPPDPQESSSCCTIV